MMSRLVQLWTTTQSQRFPRQKRFKNFPFGISQTAGILAHPRTILYVSKLVQINLRYSTIFQTAS